MCLRAWTNKYSSSRPLRVEQVESSLGFKCMIITHRRNELIVAVISNFCLVYTKYGVLEREGILTEWCYFAGFVIDVGTVE